MDAEYANYYTREVMLILIREFQSPDEEMKKIVLKVRGLCELLCVRDLGMLSRILKWVVKPIYWVVIFVLSGTCFPPCRW